MAGKRPCIEVSLTKLAVKVGTPGVDGITFVNSYGKARLLLADLDVLEEDSIHADLLRGAEDAELARTPDN